MRVLVCIREPAKRRFVDRVRSVALALRGPPFDFTLLSTLPPPQSVTSRCPYAEACRAHFTVRRFVFARAPRGRWVTPSRDSSNCERDSPSCDNLNFFCLRLDVGERTHQRATNTREVRRIDVSCCIYIQCNLTVSLVPPLTLEFRTGAVLFAVGRENDNVDDRSYGWRCRAGCRRFLSMYLWCLRASASPVPTFDGHHPRGEPSVASVTPSSSICPQIQCRSELRGSSHRWPTHDPDDAPNAIEKMEMTIVLVIDVLCQKNNASHDRNGCACAGEPPHTTTNSPRDRAPHSGAGWLPFPRDPLCLFYTRTSLVRAKRVACAMMLPMDTIF